MDPYPDNLPPKQPPIPERKPIPKRETEKESISQGDGLFGYCDYISRAREFAKRTDEASNLQALAHANIAIAQILRLILEIFKAEAEEE